MKSFTARASRPRLFFVRECRGLVAWTGLVLGLLLWLSLPVRGAEVVLGNEVLARHGFRELAGKRIGLLTNPTGVNRRGRTTIDQLRTAPGVRLVALFAPEHGLLGEFAAGKEFPDRVDGRTGLPIYSLYGPGPTRKPTKRQLQGLDVLVYDVQDLGVRSYTYISTLGLAMEACGEAGVEFMVLDRPNPLGGRRVEGPELDPRFRSFVGRWPVPYVYGLTCGELARMINGEGWITNRCRLTVIPLEGWTRATTWRGTGLPWVPTSPNVPRPENALCLVATGLLGEIGGLSIGMGADMPFECIGAPWLNGESFARRLNGLRLRGVNFKPIRYQPGRGAFKGQNVEGVRLQFTEPEEAPLVAINFHALQAVKDLTRRNLVAEAVARGASFAMIDKLCGTDAVRRALQAGVEAGRIVAAWRAGEEAFRRKRERYLLYR